MWDESRMTMTGKIYLFRTSLHSSYVGNRDGNYLKTRDTSKCIVMNIKLNFYKCEVIICE